MLNLKTKPFNLSDSDVNWIEDTLKGMTEEEKIGQIFCLITYSDNEDYLKHLAVDDKIGGLMTRTMSTEELVNTSSRLQKYAKIPMLIAANLEAGTNQACFEGTKVGCNLAIGATNDVKYAKELGRIIGEEASTAGLNWAFAPVIDIDYNWRNPITNTRTFGSDPERVAKMGAAYVQEVQKYGIAASIKHFPGDGVDERDQHLLASVNSLSVEEWDKTYGKVYKECIEAGALTVMTGHIMQPAYSKFLNPSLKDEEILPGLCSKELLQGLLREKLGFNGLIVTDSSAMAGLTAVLPRRLALPLTISAGCDMILFTKNQAEDFDFIREALKDGRITHERLDEAVTRVLALKAALKLHTKKFEYDVKTVHEAMTNKEHKQVAYEVASKSITLVKEEKGVLPLSCVKHKRILAYIKDSGVSAVGAGVDTSSSNKLIEKLKQEGFEVEVFVPSPGFEGYTKAVSEYTKNYDLLLYIVNMATKSNQTVVRIEWAVPMGADCPIFCNDLPTVAVSLENPYHLIDMPRVKTYINTYGGTDEVLTSLVNKLLGREKFEGHNPVDPFCGKWDTRL